jgi:peptidoglycan/LPS O-acetylase OafA/YrhL
VDKGRLTEVDALRGLAACGVALFGHFWHLTGQVGRGPNDDIAALEWLFRDSWLLVDLFFVISGYIFTHVYPTVEWRSFAVARFARLYPLHIVTFAIVAALAPFVAIGPNTLLQAGAHLAFLQGALQPAGFNDPAWSLTIEVACYALFVAALWRPRYFVLVCAALVALGITSIGQKEGGLIDWRLARGLVGFFAGCLIYRLKPPPLALLVMAALGAWSVFGQTVLTAVVGRTGSASLLLWPALVGLAAGRPWLAARPLQWLGDRSYSIYLTHLPVHLLMRLAYGKELPVTWGTWIVAAALVLVASDLSYRYLERPSRAAIRAAFSPSGTPQTAV